MAKHLVQLIIAGAQVVGRAFTQAVRQEIRMSQEAAKKSASRQSKFTFENLRCYSDPLKIPISVK